MANALAIVCTYYDATVDDEVESGRPQIHSRLRNYNSRLTYPRSRHPISDGAVPEHRDW
jgi:hypothetical protein